nr:hypothetical protein [Actinomycetota bacterium]
MNGRPRTGTEHTGQHGENPSDGERQGGLRWLATFVARGSARARTLLAMILVCLVFVGGAVAYDVGAESEEEAAEDEANALPLGAPSGPENSEDLVGGTTGLEPEEAEDASEEADEQRGVAGEAERFVAALLGGKNPSVELADLALAGIGGEKLSDSFSGEVEELAQKEKAAEEQPSGPGEGDAGDTPDAADEKASEPLLAAAAQGYEAASEDPSSKSAPAESAEVVRPTPSQEPAGRGASRDADLLAASPAEAGADEGPDAAGELAAVDVAAPATTSRAYDGIGASEQTEGETADYLATGDESGLIAAVENDVEEKATGEGAG